MSKIRILAAVALVSIFTAAPALAQPILYGATGSGGQPGSLYTLNQSTGAATLVGPLVDSGGGTYAMSGMAYHAPTDTLFGATVTNATSLNNRMLVRINRANGLVTPIGLFNIDGGSGGSMSDLSFQPSTNTLFGWAPLVGALFTVNLTTGATTQVGPRDPNLQGGGGLAFHPNGTLYATPDSQFSNELRIINAVTGVHSTVATITGTGTDFINAMAFNGPSLFINLSPGTTSPSNLGTLNFTSGAATYLGPNVARMDALEFVPIPEPSSMILAGLGVIAGWRLRKRVQFQRASQ